MKKAIASGMQRYSLTYFLECYYNDTINIAITFVKFVKSFEEIQIENEI